MPTDESLIEVWNGDDQDECVSICSKFTEAQVPFKVLQHKKQYLKGLELSFQIAVPAEFCDQAKKIIDKGRLDFTDEEDDQRIMELPADDDAPDCEDKDDNSNRSAERSFSR